jgi:hypothetical protein
VKRDGMIRQKSKRDAQIRSDRGTIREMSFHQFMKGSQFKYSLIGTIKYRVVPSKVSKLSV